MTELDALLVQIMANHFPGAESDGQEIDLAVGGLRLSCRVNGVGKVGSYSAAHLFFYLSGGALGEEPVFASVSGYEETPERAVIVGACNWACSFGPVFRAGLAGEEKPEVARIVAELHGQRFAIFVDGLDRVMSFDDGPVDMSRIAAARSRLGADPWLTGVLAGSGRLPLLPADRPSIISLFLGERPDGRIVEVKVHGVDWPAAQPAFAGPHEPPGAVSLLRELAVVVPIGPAAPLARSPIETTLAGLAAPLEDGARGAVDWRGWRAHGGLLAAPMSDIALARVERETGPLPADYRRFLLEVAERGAGPGYGLVAPSATLAAGELDWRDGEEPESGPAGVIPLAHAGCGVAWLLVLGGPHRGEVWVDARGADGLVRRVAASFDDWYRRWLDAALRESGPWTQWDYNACATVNVLSQVLDGIEQEGVEGDEAIARLKDRLGPDAITLSTGGSPYFRAGSPIDPCQGCAATAARVGLPDSVFGTGVAAFEEN